MQKLTLQDAILGSANYAIVSTTPEGVVTTFNATAERWLGYSAAEIVGKVTPLIWHDAGEVAARAKVLSRELGRTVEPGFESFTAKIRLGQVDENEWTLVRKDGSRFPVTLSATALMDEAGVVTGFVGVLADITQRKQAEERLRESEERFRKSFVNAPIGLALVSLEGRWARVNHVLCEMVGYSESELLATDFQTITHPEDLQADLDFVHQLVDGKIRDYQMEKRYFHKHGQIVNVLLSVSLMRDANDRPLYFISQIQDITERKQAEAKRKQNDAEREKLIGELQTALAEVKTLSGMIPICAWCKNIRADEGYWQTVEQYVRAHTTADFSHSICPDCTKKFEADLLKVSRQKSV
jgi:PAS domain S-box-containing protein